MSSAASLESSRSSSNIPHSRSSSEIVDLSLDDIDFDGKLTVFSSCFYHDKTCFKF